MDVNNSIVLSGEWVLYNSVQIIGKSDSVSSNVNTQFK